MRAACLFLGFVVVCVGGASGCLLEPGATCCDEQLDCVAGATCFEGRCALRCDDDGQCAEGEVCVELGGACRAQARDSELEACPFTDDEGRS